ARRGSSTNRCPRTRSPASSSWARKGCARSPPAIRSRRSGRCAGRPNTRCSSSTRSGHWSASHRAEICARSVSSSCWADRHWTSRSRTSSPRRSRVRASSAERETCAARRARATPWPRGWSPSTRRARGERGRPPRGAGTQAATGRRAAPPRRAGDGHAGPVRRPRGGGRAGPPRDERARDRREPTGAGGGGRHGLRGGAGLDVGGRHRGGRRRGVRAPRETARRGTGADGRSHAGPLVRAQRGPAGGRAAVQTATRDDRRTDGGIVAAQLTMDEARTVLDAALAKAVEIGQPMNVAVVDAGAHLVAFARQDGAILASIDIATRKARTAALLKMTTAQLGEAAKPGAPLYGIEGTNGGLIIF